MKCPPSPVNRDPSSSSLRYQLSASSGPALTRYRVTEPPAGWPNRDFSCTSSGAKRRLNPTISRSLPVLVHDVDDPVELVPGERQRLLDEDGLPGLQRAADQIRVGVMPGHDEDRVQRLVVEHRVGVGRRGGEAETALGVGGRQRPGGGDVRQVDVRHPRQVRQQHRGRVVAGADEPGRSAARPWCRAARFSGCAGTSRLVGARPGCRRRGRVLEQDADRRQRRRRPGRRRPWSPAPPGTPR